MSNPRKRIILDPNHDKGKKHVRKYHNSICNRFSLIRHWPLWIKTKITLVETKYCDKNTVEEPNAKPNNALIMYNSSAQINKGIRSLQFFEKKNMLVK